MTDYRALMLELDEVADKTRNRVGRNPTSDILWEASRAMGELLEKIEDRLDPTPKPRGRPKKAAE